MYTCIQQANNMELLSQLTDTQLIKTLDTKVNLWESISLQIYKEFEQFLIHLGNTIVNIQGSREGKGDL